MKEVYEREWESESCVRDGVKEQRGRDSMRVYVVVKDSCCASQNGNMCVRVGERVYVRERMRVCVRVRELSALAVLVTITFMYVCVCVHVRVRGLTPQLIIDLWPI